ncbi:MAG: 50S ribosomal protein L17 [Ignavibacteriales bacterium]|nr:50S ribosomal protein L17 [Ignavibacteriales bacterium]
MRHGVKGRKLKRTASHRSALLNNLAISLLEHKRIKTTCAKAKELRQFVEPIITKAKKGGLHNQRLILESIKDKDVVKNLLSEIVERIGDRPGGYTRVIKAGKRLGDAAEMAIIELVDFNALVNESVQTKKDAKEAAKQEKNAKANAEQGK